MSSVDVVIPCFNYGHYLPACVGSVLAQSRVDVRVLVIDDCSTDDSGDVAERLAGRDRRVSVVRHGTNRGHIATYNEGLLGWADQKYAVLLSADDLLAPGALDRAAQIMDTHPGVGMVYGYAPYFQRSESLPRTRLGVRSTSVWSGDRWIERRCRTGYNVISSPEVVVRTAVQQRVGGYDPNLPHAGDLEMWLRIAAVSDVAYVRGVAQAYYRVHERSMQRTSFPAHFDDLRQRCDAFDSFFEKSGALVADSKRLHRMAQRACAREALWRACRAHDRGTGDRLLVDELLAFAMDRYDCATSTPEFRGLQRRRSIGHRSLLSSSVVGLEGVQHRLVTEYLQARWRWWGS